MEPVALTAVTGTRQRELDLSSPGDSPVSRSSRRARTCRCLAVSRPASTDVMDHWYSTERARATPRAVPPLGFEPRLNRF